MPDKEKEKKESGSEEKILPGEEALIFITGGERPLPAEEDQPATPDKTEDQTK